MADIIKRHNFEQALKKIDEFSDTVPTVPSIPKFKTDGGFLWLGKHYINGVEMNEYVEKIQNSFKSHNDALIKTIREFSQVYRTFEYLDKEYLQGILGVASAAKEASEQATTASSQARVASEQAKDAAIKALQNEADIKKEVEVLTKIVEKLKSLKSEFVAQVYDLEIKFSSEIEKLHSELSSIPDLNEIENRFEQIEQAIAEWREKLQSEIEAQDSSLRELINDKSSESAQAIADCRQNLQSDLEAQDSSLRELINDKSSESAQAIAEWREKLQSELEAQDSSLRELINDKSSESAQAIAECRQNLQSELEAQDSSLRELINDKSSESAQAIKECRQNTVMQINQMQAAHQESITKLNRRLVISYILGGISLILAVLSLIF